MYLNVYMNVKTRKILFLDYTYIKPMIDLASNVKFLKTSSTHISKLSNIIRTLTLKVLSESKMIVYQCLRADTDKAKGKDKDRYRVMEVTRWQLRSN